jgi:hypothetical protein
MNGVALLINIASKIVVFQRKYARLIQNDIQKEQPKGLPKVPPVTFLYLFGTFTI